jgi:two-component system, chemotaxis family, sensor kinase CheA
LLHGGAFDRRARIVDELTGEFVSETRETLQNVADALVGWEANPADAARLDEIFRFVHTVKGSCGFLDLPRIGGLAHAAETALSEVRDGKRLATPALVGAMLALIDRIALLTEALESKGAVPDPATDDNLIARIDAVDPVTTTETAPIAKARAIRVSVDLLEAAMTQVSDLVLARNELARRLRDVDSDTGVSAAFDRVSLAIGDIRESIARTRMQPIDRLFAMLPRLVRDTAASLGKSAVLQIEGSDVEIDREMIEAIRDPLTHIVRNAIDHGIESADERRERGKAETGTLSVFAEQSGNQVSITVCDDGRGIDTERLIAKAIAANVISAGKAASLSPEAALQLIFSPGLSTAQSVTDISGRGVGMDIVRANVERLGGAISIDNRPGIGLAITLRAPLTLSIMNALLVEAGGQTFAMPRSAINEIVSVKSESVRVEQLGGGQVAVVRGQMLSVVPLAAILGLENTPSTHLVIVELAGGNRFALGFSGITDHEELVVRPTAPHLAALGVFAGQTLQDNGVPVLVIDAAGVAAKAGIDGPDRISASNTPAQPVAITPPSILIFEGLDGIRRAVRAGQIDHIDDVVAGDFVVRGDIAFVKTDDGLIPAILDGPLPDHGQVALLQLSVDGRPVGYPVSGVQDLAPLPLITPVADGIVEGFVLIDGEAVALLQWPRSAPVKRRARA